MNNFSSWISNSEKIAKLNGNPIRIRTKTSDNIRTVFVVVGIVSITAIIVLLFSINYLTASNDNNESSNKLITIHIIHTVELSNDTKLWIENKSIEAGDWLKENVK